MSDISPIYASKFAIFKFEKLENRCLNHGETNTIPSGIVSDRANHSAYTRSY